MSRLSEQEFEARMAALSEEAIRVAEEVWSEDEPTLAEYELAQRILGSASSGHVVHVTAEPVAEDVVWCDDCEEWVASSAPEAQV